MKRLPSVFKQLPTCFLGICCLLFANTTLAQTYQPGIQLDDSLVVFVGGYPGLYLLHLHTLEGTFTTRLIKY